jgi:serine-type D-Ala-D-Ala carboxypeptidase
LRSLLFSALVLAVTPHGGGVPVKAPESVGMSAERLAMIDHIVERGISAGGYPGAAVVVGRRGVATVEKGFGRLSWSTNDQLVSPDSSIYDLASLTKVIATTSAIMVLYDEGKIHLDDPAKKYIPEFSGGNKDKVTIRLLLEHRSGLPPGRNLWHTAHSPAEARAQVISTKLGYRPGQYYEYSDLGADMLGFIVEAASGERLDRFVAEHVYEPLGMNNTFFRPSASLRAMIAPTEMHPPRGYPLRGEVHDENAYALGGVAGHAGLFSTAADLAIFAQMMLNGGQYNGVRVFAETTVTLFTKRAALTRALGWDTCDDKSSCGKYLSTRSFGHTGFTGTSIWMDPDRDMFVVLLTNRVNEPRAKRPATVIADVRADLADAAALSVTDAPEGVPDMPTEFRADKALGWNKTLPHKVVAAVAKIVSSVKKPTTPKATASNATSPTVAAKAAGKSTAAAVAPAASAIKSAPAASPFALTTGTPFKNPPG